MADTVKSRTLVLNEHKSVFLLTNSSDGTGESAVTKVDISALPGTPTKVRITRLEFHVHGMSLNIYFDRTSGGDIGLFNGDGCIKEAIEDSGTGLTGDIKFTTLNIAAANAGTGYTVLLEVEKVA